MFVLLLAMIFRISDIEVYSRYVEAYLPFASEVAAAKRCPPLWNGQVDAALGIDAGVTLAAVYALVSLAGGLTAVSLGYWISR